MPSLSKSQQALFAIAEHHPEKLNKENRRLAKLPKSMLHEYAATRTRRLPVRVSVRRKKARVEE